MTEPNEPNATPERTGAAEAAEAEPAELAEPAVAEPAEVEPAAVAAPPVGWLPRSATELFGEGATAEEAYDLLTVDVPADSWIASLETARDTLGCTYFDWLSAVDEPGTGFRVAAYVVALGGSEGAGAAGRAVRCLLVRTTVPHEAAALPTATGVYAGATWHERETHEMFGIGFTGHPGLAPLLLPDGFEGHPLRKDFVLAARVVKAWPGAKEPGESGTGHGPKRRQMLPPGVPDPNEWGPLKGQLPPAPARPARGARAAGAAAGDRPARRTRTATAGSASQRPAGAEPTAEARPPAAERPAGAEAVGETPAPAAERPVGAEAPRPVAERPARRSRSVGEGSASQRPAGAEPTAEASAPDAAGRRAAADEPSAAAEPPAPEAPAADDAAGAEAPAAVSPAHPRRPAPRTRSSDAPWHHARPARDEDAESPREPEAPKAAEAEADGDGRGGETPGPASEAPDIPDAPDSNSDDQPGGTA
ncbi:NADH-quinone oxidoreductase subunit C [Streptomyces antimycoticus]|uniref:NADH-quinone oxidoreductase subunit C n=1 Tax=Streptomyces antimycoticus TaxID=68175 RepID=UPI0036A362B1